MRKSVTPSVQRRYIISTDKGVQYGSVTSSVLTRVCSTVLPKLLREAVDGCTYLEEGYLTDHPIIT